MHHSRRDILGLLHENRRKHVTLQAHHQAIRSGTSTNIFQRLSPAAEADWDAVVRTFTTLHCKLRAFYSGTNNWPEPLLSLEVKPLQDMPTLFPDHSETPWHISIAFYEPQKSREFRKIVQKYAEWREFVLVGNIYGGMFELDPERCPVGSDEDILALKRQGYYGDRPMHISM